MASIAASVSAMSINYGAWYQGQQVEKDASAESSAETPAAEDTAAAEGTAEVTEEVFLAVFGL